MPVQRPFRRTGVLCLSPSLASVSDLPLPLADRIRVLADEAAADGDLFVLDVIVRGHAAARVVEVFVESETGAGADDLAAMSRRLGFLLDTDEAFAGAYRLDVSTPGADRPLTDVRQFRRHLGRTLAVRYRPDADAASGGETVEVVAPLTAVEGTDDAAVLVFGDDAPSVPYADVTEARVRLPW